MNTNFYYDPQRQGYDLSVWKTISGTPSIVANKLRMTSAQSIGLSDIYSGDLTINATFPVAPVAGQDKRIGFAQLNMGAYVGFKIVDDKFYCEAASPDTAIVTSEITWSSTWTAAPIALRIQWENSQVKFYIKLVGSNNEAFVGEINNTVALPKYPLSLHIDNGNADNFDIGFMDLRNAVAHFPDTPVDVTISAGDIEIGAVELKNASDDTRAIINAANTARVNTNPVLLTQLIDASGVVNGVSVTSPSTLFAGEKTVAVPGTAEALGASQVTKSIYIRAKTSNAQNVYVGDSAVDKTTSQQVILTPGSAIGIDIANRASVFVDADIAVEGVDYLLFI